MLTCDPLYLRFGHTKTTSNQKVFKIKFAQNFKIYRFIIYYNFNLFIRINIYVGSILPMIQTLKHLYIKKKV